MPPLQLAPALSIAAVMTVGVSQEAVALQKEVDSFKQGSLPFTGGMKPISLRSAAEELTPELSELWAECRFSDWDGYGAAALNAKAVNRTIRFLQQIPSGFPLPELSALPNGDVGLDWDFAPRRTITVSIAASPRLAYAAIDGDEEWSGTVSFLSEIPLSLLATIRRLANA